MELQELLPEIVALNRDHRIVGKTRLQKVFFLLDQCGLNSGAKYNYHHYGPYSADITDAAEDAVLYGNLTFEERPGFYDIPYGIYEASKQPAQVANRLGSLPKETVQEKLNIMSEYSAIELELAATLQFLRAEGFARAVEEVKQLKPAKANERRMQHAVELLRRLGLS
jgi:uncharacterized protein YwgA